MLVYGRRLVILPFRVDTMLEESENTFQEADSENTSQVLPSYTIVLKSIDDKIENVIDIQFLHGYYEPTVLILYEPVRTFSGYGCNLLYASFNELFSHHKYLTGD